MANQEVLREFLVSLGWKIDESGQKKFVDSVAAASVRVAELGAAIAAASAAVVAGVTKIADQMESLYFASQRTGAAVANIQALGFAAAQMGSTVDAARGSLENLARFMRNSPGAAGLIQGLGVQTQGTNGQLRDTADILKDLGKQFANMPYYRANAYAQALGIDEKTLMALRQGLGQFGDEYKDMLAKAGLNSQQAAESSHAFMNEVRSLGAAFVILGQKVATSLTGKMSGDIKRFREGLVDNFGRIAAIVEKIANGILKLADVVSTLALRGMQAIGAVIDWFDSLDDTTKKVIEGLGLLLIAWKALSAGILATPTGRVLLLGTALLSLYDDYKVWQEGGKSLLNWEVWEQQIEKALFGLSKIGHALRALSKLAQDAWHGNWAALGKDWEAVKGALTAKEVAPGFSQTDIDAAKNQGGVKLTSDAQKRLAALPAPSSQEPRGIRNNNPGNLNFARQVGATLESGPNARFAAFKTPEEGLQALAHQLRLYAQRGINSIRSIISKFAPASENNTQAYIANVAKSLGVGSEAALNLSDPRIMQSLMGAIIRVENGKNPYSAEQIAAASGVRAAGAPASAPVSVSQTTTIHVTGSGDSHSTAQAVAQAQSGVNQRLVRNMKVAIQ
ncbi:lytic transglycosylase catalytic [Burkholderia sp. Bp9090]|uniref:lytic transglycosylase catalytic n=1 Tax=Burkholderia sp. Bp9090 TaxID=2184567 RepID=UPI000F5F3562|nr:lytic transglycosylase catalytic [Burkholderia sp. Bp9090]RQZ27471.1 lytic transglycosylase catalytic [Burkholderia sp. Bp9090]